MCLATLLTTASILAEQVKVPGAIPGTGAIPGAGAVRDGRVEAELIAQHKALVPGTTATLGLRLEMDEGWHTYWKNPGDSGMATSIAWDLPDGFVAHDIDWPAPDHFEVSGLASYAYEGQIVLPVRVEVPEDFSGQTVTLRASADWLVCKVACEPGTAELALTLPVRGQGEAEADPEHAALFAWAEARRPEPTRDDAVSAALAEGKIMLGLVDPRLSSTQESRKADARFFPDDPMAIDMSADQPLRPADDAGISLKLTPNPRGEVPERLTGVVAYRDGDTDCFLEIDTPVRNVADDQ